MKILYVRSLTDMQWQVHSMLSTADRNLRLLGMGRLLLHFIPVNVRNESPLAPGQKARTMEDGGHTTQLELK